MERNDKGFPVLTILTILMCLGVAQSFATAEKERVKDYVPGKAEVTGPLSKFRMPASTDPEWYKNPKTYQPLEAKKDVDYKLMDTTKTFTPKSQFPEAKSRPIFIENKK